VEEYKDRLRRLAVGDESFIKLILALGPGDVELSRLDPKAHALVRLAGLLGANASPTSYYHAVAMALAAGATPDEIVGTLIALAPTIGLARVVSAAPELALPIGYDLDSALESSNGDP
jgi:alkylhydroperoxidase/carboxymuconolactone decarboxylase family protein YurZ